MTNKEKMRRAFGSISAPSDFTFAEDNTVIKRRNHIRKMPVVAACIAAIVIVSGTGAYAENAGGIREAVYEILNGKSEKSPHDIDNPVSRTASADAQRQKVDADHTITFTTTTNKKCDVNLYLPDGVSAKVDGMESYLYKDGKKYGYATCTSFPTGFAYDDYKDDTDLLMYIYSDYTIGNHYRFNIQGTYEKVTSSESGETGICRVDYEPSANDEKEGKKPTHNTGIVCYDKNLKMVFALEIYDKYSDSSKNVAKQIAETVRMSPYVKAPKKLEVNLPLADDESLKCCFEDFRYETIYYVVNNGSDTQVRAYSTKTKKSVTLYDYKKSVDITSITATSVYVYWLTSDKEVDSYRLQDSHYMGTVFTGENHPGAISLNERTAYLMYFAGVYNGGMYLFEYDDDMSGNDRFIRLPNELSGFRQSEYISHTDNGYAVAFRAENGTIHLGIIGRDGIVADYGKVVDVQSLGDIRADSDYFAYQYDNDIVVINRSTGKKERIPASDITDFALCGNDLIICRDRKSIEMVELSSHERKVLYTGSGIKASYQNEATVFMDGDKGHLVIYK